MHNSSNQQYSILVADDELAIRRILEIRLNMMGYSIFTAADGVEALEIFDREHPDLIILDVRMPKLDGYGVCQAVRKTSSVPIIMLTAVSDVKDRINGLNMGADDYMVKPFSAKELESRVRSILRRLEALKSNKFRNTDVIEIGSLHFDTNKRQVFKDGKLISLTYMEYNLLLCLASSPGKPISRQKLLQEIWGYSKESIVDTRAIDVHMSHLRHKLKANQLESELIETIRGVGYTLNYAPSLKSVNREAS